MSIYLSFDDQPGEQIATNHGWGDFVRWASNLDLENYEETVQFAEHGMTGAASDVSDQLKAALRDRDFPNTPGMRDLVEVLASMLDVSSSEWAFVTDGTGPTAGPTLSQELGGESGH